MFKDRSIFKFAGIIIPIILFISPSSPILLATSKLEDGAAFSVPLSFLLLPFLLYWSFYKGKIKSSKSYWFYLLLSVFFIWMTLLAIYSSIKTSTDSYLYLMQWISPYLFIFFYATIKTLDDLIIFLKGFFIGTIFSCSYVFLAGVLEFLFLGIGNGRMSQNIIMPGFYQLYVYVPTVLAFSSLISICAIRAHLIEVKKQWLYLLLFLSFFSILFTGAREGLLVYILGLLGIFILKNKKTLFIKAVIIILGISIIYVNKDYLFEQADKSEIMVFQKYARLKDKNSSLAGRDIQIEKFSKIIDQEPMIGTAMLPANYHSHLGVDEGSSAHNYYYDSYAWAGFFNFIIILLLFFLLLINSLLNIFRNLSNNNPLTNFFVLMNFFLIIFILVSNNINVAMRQPLSGAIGGFLIYNCIYFRELSNYRYDKEQH